VLPNSRTFLAVAPHHTNIQSPQIAARVQTPTDARTKKPAGDSAGVVLPIMRSRSQSPLVPLAIEEADAMVLLLKDQISSFFSLS